MEQRLTDMKFRFFTNMSHELRTPLTLIITPLNSIVNALEQSELKQKLEAILNHAKELLEMINNLLSFRKLEMGEMKLIIESTAYCMSKVEDDFMAKAPTDPKDVMRFIEEVPHWTKEKHGKKYRLMYQVYTLPKYIDHGKKFFEGVNERYTAYAKMLEPKIGIPYTVITPLIFIFVRACVHYAMFEDEYYLNSQMEIIKLGVSLFIDKYKKEN